MDKLSTLLACLPPSDFKNIFTHEIEQLRTKVAELEAKLEKYENLEPVGYFEQEYVGGPVLFYQVNYKAEGSIPLYALEMK